MFDTFFITLNSWITDTFWLAILGSFLWGSVSVLFSPCHLASIPLMIGYIAGQDNNKNNNPVIYALLFSGGLFVSIAAIGVVSMMLGRMLGNISPLWGVPVGVLFIWLGLDLAGVKGCKVPSLGSGRIKIKGYIGSMLLGLSYGLLSGACTFGFIAPILAIITVQQQVVTGVILLLAFALGHCMPIAIAGSSVKLVQKILDSKNMQTATVTGRKIAGLLVAAVGIFIILNALYTRFIF